MCIRDRLDPVLKERLKGMFRTMLNDNQQARELESDGTYVRVKNEKAPLNSQECFYTEAYEQNLPKERS